MQWNSTFKQAGWEFRLERQEDSSWASEGHSAYHREEGNPMPIINFDQFAECFAGDAELEREIIEIFFKTGMESVRILESAIKSRDSARIASEAHKLKGSCLALGADTLARLCETIQEGAKTSSPACLCGFVELARVNFATLHDVLIVRNGELRGSIRRVA